MDSVTLITPPAHCPSGRSGSPDDATDGEEAGADRVDEDDAEADGVPSGGEAVAADGAPPVASVLTVDAGPGEEQAVTETRSRIPTSAGRPSRLRPR